MSDMHLRYRTPHRHLVAPFGTDPFGRASERFARLFGTPAFILGQTGIVALWIAVNVVAAALRWDPYPFILLNLAFSLQAAYAAPLILLAQTRQAERDKADGDADAEHREALARETRLLLERNIALTEELRAAVGRLEAR